MFDKIKQLKELRDQAEKIKSMLEHKTVTASASGGDISIVMNGNQHIVSIDIHDRLLDPTKKLDLTRGLLDAHAEAIAKAQRVMAETMRESGGLSLPGM